MTTLDDLVRLYFQLSFTSHILSAFFGVYSAGEKGRAGFEGFLFGFLLGPLGVIAVACLPTRATQSAPPKPAPPTKPAEIAVPAPKAPQATPTKPAPAPVSRAVVTAGSLDDDGTYRASMGLERKAARTTKGGE